MNLDYVLEVAESNSLDNILGVIYTVYLSKREKNLYNMMSLYVNGKSQRELGILFNLHQDKVSNYLKKLRKKLRRIYTTLTVHNEELKEMKSYLLTVLSKQQMEVVELLMLGNKKIRIAEKFDCSAAHITAVIARIYKKLPDERSIQLEQLINDLQ